MTNTEAKLQHTPCLVYSREHNAFWKPNSMGYTNLIEHAGRYSHAEASEICDGANTGLDPMCPNEVLVVAPEILDSFYAMRDAVECFLRTWKKAGPNGSYQFEKFDTAVRLCEIALDRANGEQAK